MSKLLEFDFNNNTYLEANFIASFDIFKPHYGFVNIKCARDSKYIYVLARLLGYTKDQNNIKFSQTRFNICGQTAYETEMKLEDFFDRLKTDKNLLDDVLNTLEYAINKHENELKEEANKL